MNVEQLLKERNINYRESGNDLLVHCLNPDHEDTNPSMRIDKILGIFNCWSCGYKGNLFHLYKVESNKLSIIREKVRRKVEKSGSVDPLDLPYDAILYTGSYRGLKESTCKQYQFFTTNQYDLENRLVIPIKDSRENIYAFIGRDLYNTSKSKYLFYPSHRRIHHYPTAKFTNGKLIIVEGIFDALNLVDKGISCVSCIFGVNNLTEEDLVLLEMKGLTKLIIMLDSDEPGQKGARFIAELCKKLNMDYENVVLEGHKDPGELDTNEVLKLKVRLNV